MEKRLQNPKGRLKWFLDFINSKIDLLSDRELLNLWMDLTELAYGGAGVLAIGSIDNPERLRFRRQQVVKIQQILRDSLEKVLLVSKKPKKAMIRPLFRDDQEAREEIGDIPDGLYNPLEAFIVSEMTKITDAPPSKWTSEYVALTIPMEMKVLSDKNAVAMVTTRLEDKLRLEFITSLSLFPLSNILQCQREDCRGYFLKATKKEKRYCSNKCAWVVASRERRMVQPEREKEKKRRSYERRKKREVGPNVKVVRRSRREG